MREVSGSDGSESEESEITRKMFLDTMRKLSKVADSVREKEDEWRADVLTGRATGRSTGRGTGRSTGRSGATTTTTTTTTREKENDENKEEIALLRARVQKMAKKTRAKKDTLERESRWGVTGVDQRTGTTAKERREREIMERTRNGLHQGSQQRRAAHRRNVENKKRDVKEKKLKERKKEEEETARLVERRASKAVAARARKQAAARIARETKRATMRREEQEEQERGMDKGPTVVGGGGSLISPMTSPTSGRNSGGGSGGRRGRRGSGGSSTGVSAMQDELDRSLLLLAGGDDDGGGGGSGGGSGGEEEKREDGEEEAVERLKMENDSEAAILARRKLLRMDGEAALGHMKIVKRMNETLRAQKLREERSRLEKEMIREEKEKKFKEDLSNVEVLAKKKRREHIMARNSKRRIEQAKKKRIQAKEMDVQYERDRLRAYVQHRRNVEATLVGEGGLHHHQHQQNSHSSLPSLPSVTGSLGLSPPRTIAEGGKGMIQQSNRFRLPLSKQEIKTPRRLAVGLRKQGPSQASLEQASRDIGGASTRQNFNLHLQVLLFFFFYLLFSASVLCFCSLLLVPSEPPCLL